MALWALTPLPPFFWLILYESPTILRQSEKHKMGKKKPLAKAEAVSVYAYINPVKVCVDLAIIVVTG